MEHSNRVISDANTIVSFWPSLDQPQPFGQAGISELISLLPSQDGSYNTSKKVNQFNKIKNFDATTTW